MTRILLVDNNEDNLYLLQTILSRAGHEVDTATDGEKALQAAEANVPDVVISDIFMPVMDGYALCRAWKSNERFERIPFVFYTGTCLSREDEELARSLGVDGFIRKPMRNKDFVAAVQDVIEQQQSGRLKARVMPADAASTGRRYSEARILSLEERIDLLERANRELQNQLKERADDAEQLQSPEAAKDAKSEDHRS
ncbi:MAG TPA: response regulator [Oligoflexia bacterium]|nr:response regulator [Oligoflexia bacterium]